MKKILIFVVALFISNSAIANKELICPDLENYLKPIELNESTQMIAPDTLYMHSGLNYLTHRQLWSIHVGPVKGGRQESLKIANDLLKEIHSPGIIKYSEDMHRFYCAYSTEDDSVYITVMTYDFDD